MAPRVVALALLAALGRADPLMDPSKELDEKDYGLDLTLFDEHLAKVNGCLKALPQSPDAGVLDCIAYEDAAIARCDKVYGKQLEACMADTKPVSGLASDLMPELRKIRWDLISCYDKLGIRPRMVQTMLDPLSRCGVVQLHSMVPDHYIKMSDQHIREFMHDKELFEKHYKDVHKPDVGSTAGMHDLPLNLPGGRFEAVPPATGDIIDLVEFVTKSFNAPRRLEPIWTGGSPAELSYVLIRGQHADTAVVTDQEWHQDRDTTEDIRISMSVAETGPEAGPMEILPTSHRFHPSLQPPTSVWSKGRAISPLARGDMIFYFARTQRRETKRTGDQPRVSLELVLHSTGRFYHPSSDRDEEKVETRYLQAPEPKKAMDAFKKLWAATIEKNKLGSTDEAHIYHFRREDEEL